MASNPAWEHATNCQCIGCRHDRAVAATKKEAAPKAKEMSRKWDKRVERKEISKITGKYLPDGGPTKIPRISIMVRDAERGPRRQKMLRITPGFLMSIASQWRYPIKGGTVTVLDAAGKPIATMDPLTRERKPL